MLRDLVVHLEELMMVAILAEAVEEVEHPWLWRFDEELKDLSIKVRLMVSPLSLPIASSEPTGLHSVDDNQRVGGAL